MRLLYNKPHIMAPKDEKIINKDNSATNQEAADTDLEKGGQENLQEKPDDKLVPTVTPDNDNGDPGPTSEKPAVEKGEQEDKSVK